MKLANKPISPNPQAGNVKLGKGNEGLTLLEYYAGLMMQARLSDPESGGTYESFAAEAVKYAKALIAELEKHQ